MAGIYDLDPAHTSAHFSVRHMMISNVKGEFTKVSGTVTFDPDNLQASSMEAVIDATSIRTRDDQRDAHLKSADFLDVEHYPEIRFRSTRIEREGSEYTIHGDLTIRGVTKDVALKVEDLTPETKDPWGNLRAGATATTKIKRSDFGVAFNMVLETGGLLVGEQVSITIDAELVRRPA
jgi:polyisoprenoid-binding protein YceI